ncbi:nuclease [bacterium]|nr:nuclease [bacterium]
MRLRSILTVPLLMILHLAMSAQAAPSGREAVTWYPVTRVVDGDTFWVDDGSETGLKIRLIGVDAPEPRNTGNKLKGYFGSESSDYLAQLLHGRKVRFEFDVSRLDRYGRTLAYVYLDDGTFVNADLVKKGYATVMTIPPNVRHADEFVRLAEKARKQKKGLWKPDPSQTDD